LRSGLTANLNEPRKARTIFLNDLHLGCRHTKAAALLSFLKSQRPDYLYLVGMANDEWAIPGNENAMARALQSRKGTDDSLSSAHRSWNACFSSSMST